MSTDDIDGLEVVSRAKWHLLHSTGLHYAGDRAAYDLLTAVQHAFIMERRKAYTVEKWEMPVGTA